MHILETFVFQTLAAALYCSHHHGERSSQKPTFVAMVLHLRVVSLYSMFQALQIIIQRNILCFLHVWLANWHGQHFYYA